jgi:AbiV family abortive infection protein
MKNKIASINDPRNLITLAELAFQNAQSLYKEAKILLFFRKSARALFLAQIGGEELGKYILCTSTYTQFRTGNFDINKFNKTFYKHTKKTLLVNFFEDILLDAEVKSKADREKDTELLEKAKFFGLYTDVFQDQYLVSPNDLIQHNMAKKSVKWLGNRLKLFKKAKILEKTKILEQISDEKIKESWNKYFKKFVEDLNIEYDKNKCF